MALQKDRRERPLSVAAGHKTTAGQKSAHRSPSVGAYG